MKNNRYKILVLSDLKSATVNTLKSSISLAKMIDGEIDFFHVKKPTDIVEQESQLSAIRTINELHTATSKEIQEIIAPISKEYNVSIGCKHAFGNVKNEISDYVDQTKPDIIVLGKRKTKTFSFVGDNITDYVIKNHDALIMIASEDKTLEPNSELSLGFLNNIEDVSNYAFTESILNYSQKPLTSFKVANKSSKSSKEQASTTKRTIEYVFEDGANTANSLSNYVAKSDVNLLFVNKYNKVGSSNTNIKELINKVDVSLLISA
ncbi:universal stress protein [uncultured Psychroserpens sp.]|uniref:universal stress protein n=1 Tax=uncultured Psychroserpens sp. TaxID=255436 RepID=UPI002638AECB|nr:universal stress protein [uncultured Psychroserpens sp.]